MDFFKYWFLLHCFRMPGRGILWSSHFRKKEIKGSRWCNSGLIHLQEILGRLPLNLHRRDKHFFEPCCNAFSLTPKRVFHMSKSVFRKRHWHRCIFSEDEQSQPIAPFLSSIIGVHPHKGKFLFTAHVDIKSTRTSPKFVGGISPWYQKNESHCEAVGALL